MMCMKFFTKIKICLILVSIQKIRSFTMQPRNKNIIGRMKDEAKGISVVEFVELKSKMY